MREIARQLQSGDFSLSEDAYKEMKEDYLAMAVTVVDIVNGAAYFKFLLFLQHLSVQHAAMESGSVYVCPGIIILHFNVVETEGGQNQVCKAMEERIDRERIETLFAAVKNLMEAMKMTAEQAMTVLKISDADKVILAKRF